MTSDRITNLENQIKQRDSSIVALRPRVEKLEEELNKRDDALKKLEATLKQREEELRIAKSEASRLSEEHAKSMESESKYNSKLVF
jgi:flagellar biosynthesis chaperone FliJ